MTVTEGTKTDTVVLAVNERPPVTAVVATVTVAKRPRLGETVVLPFRLQLIGLPLDVKAPSTMTTPGEVLPHLLTAILKTPGLGHPLEANAGQRQQPKMVTLGANRKTCIEGMVDMMEVETTLSGTRHPFSF